jgi:hypothetical protein
MYCARTNTVFTTFIPAVHNFYLTITLQNKATSSYTNVTSCTVGVQYFTADLLLIQNVLNTSTVRLKNIAYTQNEILCCLSQQIEIGVLGDCDISPVSSATPEVRLLQDWDGRNSPSPKLHQ